MSIGPLKLKKHKHNIIPWHTETTRSLRQAFRRAERKWKRHKLQVSYELLRDSLSAFQHAAKAAKSRYFSELITQTAISQIFYMKSALHPVVTIFADASVSGIL